MDAEYTLDDLKRFLASVGVTHLPANCGPRLTTLFEALLRVNAQVNLTRIAGWEDYLVKHVADSLLIAAAMPDWKWKGSKVADVGCGAGFPGLPVALAFPTASFTLIDSRSKKVGFVQEQVEALGLTNCRGVAGRARELARLPEHAGVYDLVLARAVAPAPDLVRECKGLLKSGGVLAVYKTPEGLAAERAVIDRDAKKVNLVPQSSTIFVLPRDSGRRQFWLLKKQ